MIFIVILHFANANNNINSKLLYAKPSFEMCKRNIVTRYRKFGYCFSFPLKYIVIVCRRANVTTRKSHYLYILIFIHFFFGSGRNYANFSDEWTLVTDAWRFFGYNPFGFAFNFHTIWYLVEVKKWIPAFDVIDLKYK